MSGRVGGAVFSNDQDGVGMRQYNPISKQPFSEKQLAREAAFTKANQTWPALDDATVSQWKEYSETQKKRNPITGKYRSRNPKDVFVGLYAKCLQVAATSALPSIPAGPYAGEAGTVSVVSQTGSLVFEGTVATSAQGRLEGEIQRLPSKNAQPTESGYRSAFIAPLTVDEGLSVSVPVRPGYYACRFSWVNAQTGQATTPTPLPIVSVALAVEAGGAPEAAKQKKAA